jgi:hypothetical protein
MQAICLFLIFVSLSCPALTKDELFRLIDENNLMIKEERSNLNAISNAPQSNIAPPEISLSEMNGKTPFIDKEMKMQTSVEISQMIQNPYKFKIDKEFKKRNIEVQENQIKIANKSIRNDAYLIFLELSKNNTEYELLSQKKSFLQKIFNRLRSGQVQGQEERIQLVDAENDFKETSINLTLNRNEKNRMKRMLNQMIGSDLESNISDPILETIEKISPSNIEENSKIKSIDSKINLMDTELSMKKSEFYPDLSFKVKFNKSYVPNIEDSKEIMFGITLPFLYWGQVNANADSTRYKIEAMKHAKENELTNIKSKEANLREEINDLILTLNFLKENSLKSREKKLNIYANYSYTDMKSLMNYKMVFDDFYMTKMKILEKEIELQKKYFEWTELKG